MRLIGIQSTLKLGIKSLWMHKLRSTLTTLGIVFGVCSVISMLAIGEGASNAAQEAIQRLGSSNLIIETVEPPQKNTDTSEADVLIEYGLRYTDAESIRNTIHNIEVVVPIREIDHEAAYTNCKTAVKIIGTVPWYLETSRTKVLKGRFLCSNDVLHAQNVCVIDTDVADKLFLFDDPYGADIRIFGCFYKVIGIVGSAGQADNVNLFAQRNELKETSDKGTVGKIYIPVTTAKTRFNEYKASYSSGNQKISKVELQKITVKVGGFEQVIETKNLVDKLLSRLHEKQDYKIIAPLELLREAARTKRIFNIVLGSIAAMSLIVGGIGIMNIMLASVSERTREIGIRRALGAKKRDIIGQFLSETVMLTLLGGILGIIVGVIIPIAVEYFSSMPTIITGWSLMISFGISGIVGVTFGLYPAIRAANMDPIESLRHE